MSRTMTGESAYLRGREAFRRGLPVVDNPTFPGSTAPSGSSGPFPASGMVGGAAGGARRVDHGTCLNQPSPVPGMSALTRWPRLYIVHQKPRPLKSP